MHDRMNARMIACVNARMLVSCPEIGLHINVNKIQEYKTQGIQVLENNFDQNQKLSNII